MTVKDYSTRSRVRSFIVRVITCATHVSDICLETFFTAENLQSKTCSHSHPTGTSWLSTGIERTVLKSQSFCGCTLRSKYVLEYSKHTNDQ